MKVSGFTFIRNAIIYDYPVVESIKSILPLCDEFIVSVGNSEDQTRLLIESISDSKIKIIDTIWDDTLRKNGEVLALETNKALAAVSEDSTWCFYIQGDEVLEDGMIEYLKSAMTNYQDNMQVDGFLLKYRHFFGSYDYTGVSNSWYKNEIRIIRNRIGVSSYKDAQGFRKMDNKKLTVVSLDAHIHHYGWVKDPRSMQQKQESFNKYWHDDEWMKKNILNASEFVYEENMTELKKFEGSHPLVIHERIKRLNWQFSANITMRRKSFKDIIKDLLLKLGINASYQNYRVFHHFKKSS